MQLEYHCEDDVYYECNIPEHNAQVLPGIDWGHAGTPFTPAYWRLVSIVNAKKNNSTNYHLGKSLKEEVIACLLGGHGITGELGVAAYHHLINKGILEKDFSAQEIESLLREPFELNGKFVKYRYPKKKAKYIFSAINFLRKNNLPGNNGKVVRDWLIAIPGIGYKTASWIVRNWLDADDVAILDIHIHRAGVLMGIYDSNDNVARDYLKMEEKFIQMSKQIDIPANMLDSQIWHELRSSPGIVRRMLLEKKVESTDRCGLPSANYSSASRNNGLLAGI